MAGFQVRLTGGVWAPDDSDERRRIIRQQLSGSAIEAVDHDLVDAQVGAEGELVGLIDVDRMGVGALLVAWIDARALVLMD